MSDWKPSDARKIAVTSTDKSENFITGCTGCLISSDGDCFVDFDKPALTSSLLIKANQVPVYVPLMFTQIHAITSGGTANLYVMGLRQQVGR